MIHISNNISVENVIVRVFDLVLLLLATIFLLPSVTELIVVFGGLVFTVQMKTVGVGPSFQPYLQLLLPMCEFHLIDSQIEPGYYTM